MISKTQPSRLPRLDSVRGIAALMVGGFHTLGLGQFGPIGEFFEFLVDGRVAVSIFFVLSGLVLGMSLHRGGPFTFQRYAAFMIRRFFRLCPAFGVSTLIYVLFYLYLKSAVNRGVDIGYGFFNSYYGIFSDVKSVRELAENFVFASQSLNLVTWTLKVEAYAAFLLPLLHLLSGFFRWRGHLVILAGLILVSFLSTGSTRICLFLFYAGYLLPAALRALNSVHLSKPRFLHWLMLATVLSTFFAAHELAPIQRQVGVLFSGIGAFVLLGLLLAGSRFDDTIFRPLDYPAVRFLGAISYSFYLLYPICMDLVQRRISALIAHHGLAWQLLVFGPAVVLAAFVGYISYRFVEKPAIRVGARFYSRQEQSLPAAPQPHASGTA